MSKPSLAVMTATAVLAISGTVWLAYAQVQSGDQQKCLNGINKDGAGVAKAQGKLNNACLKDAGKGVLIGDYDDCLTDDAKGKVQKAQDKTSADATKNCGTTPDFGFTSPATVNDAASQGEIDLFNDVFGGDLNSAARNCNVPTSKPGCLCQQQVMKAVTKLADIKLKEFVKCKQAALKANASSITALRDCVNNAGTPGSIAADTNGKIAKGVTKLTDTIVKKCVDKNAGDVTFLFPGDCDAETYVNLPACLDKNVECRVCQILNEMDGLFVNCDLFDNGAADASCDSGTGPTPTPSATATKTATPTPTSTPQPTCTPAGAGSTEVKGALTATTGRFNYNLTLGLPGADAACNTNFPGTHACELTELQGAPTSDLICLKDTSNATVTGFWVINRSNSMDLLNQCYDDATFPCPGGTCTTPNHNWEYGTAHTPSRGRRAPLTNSTGVVGAAGGQEQCNFVSSWVGCCL